VNSRDVKGAFKHTPETFEPYKEYYEKISSFLSSEKSFSPTEVKSLKQLVFGLHLLDMDQYITFPLLTDEDT
jgi:hypothetical protein